MFFLLHSPLTEARMTGMYNKTLPRWKVVNKKFQMVFQKKENKNGRGIPVNLCFPELFCLHPSFTEGIGCTRYYDHSAGRHFPRCATAPATATSLLRNTVPSNCEPTLTKHFSYLCAELQSPYYREENHIEGLYTTPSC
jgi:hypothetical protein